MILRPEEIAAYGAVWRQRWEATLEACTRLGGTPKGFYLALSDENDGEVFQVETDFLVAPPAAESAILAAEDALGRPIPSELRQVLLHFSGEVNFGWEVPVKFDTPAILKEASKGDCRWSLEDIADATQTWDRYFQEFTDEKLFAFMTLHSGDLLAIRETDFPSESPVVYIDHEYGTHHLYALGNSFVDFLNRWTQIGCIGPEWWSLKPFVESETSGILGNCANARLWRDVFLSNTNPFD